MGSADTGSGAELLSAGVAGSVMGASCWTVAGLFTATVERGTTAAGAATLRAADEDLGALLVGDAATAAAALVDAVRLAVAASCRTTICGAGPSSWWLAIAKPPSKPPATRAPATGSHTDVLIFMPSMLADFTES